MSDSRVLMDPANLTWTDASPYPGGDKFVEAYRQAEINLPAIVLIASEHYNPRDCTRDYEIPTLVRIEAVQEQRRIYVTDYGGKRITSIVEHCPVQWTLKKSKTVSKDKKKTLVSIAKKYKLPVEISGGKALEKYLTKEKFEFDPPLQEILEVKEAKGERFFKGNLIRNGILEKEPTFIPVDLPVDIFVANGFRAPNSSEEWSGVVEMFKLACFTTAIMYRNTKPPDMFVLLERPSIRRNDDMPQVSKSTMVRDSEEQFVETDQNYIDGNNFIENSAGASQTVNGEAVASAVIQQQKPKKKQKQQQLQQKVAEQDRARVSEEVVERQQAVEVVEDGRKQQQQQQQQQLLLKQQREKQLLEQQKFEQEQQQLMQQHQQQKQLIAEQKQQEKLVKQQLAKQQLEQEQLALRKQQQQQQVLDQQQLQQLNQEREDDERRISETSAIRQKTASPYHNQTVYSDSGILQDDEIGSSVSHQPNIVGHQSITRHQNPDITVSDFDEFSPPLQKSIPSRYLESDDTDGDPSRNWAAPNEKYTQDRNYPERIPEYDGEFRQENRSHGNRSRDSERTLEYDGEIRRENVPRDHSNRSRNSHSEIPEPINLDSDLERMHLDDQRRRIDNGQAMPRRMNNDQAAYKDHPRMENGQAVFNGHFRYPDEDLESLNERRSRKSQGSVVDRRTSVNPNEEWIQERRRREQIYQGRQQQPVQDSTLDSDAAMYEDVRFQNQRRPTSRGRSSRSNDLYHEDQRYYSLPHPSRVQKRNTSSRASYMAPPTRQVIDARPSRRTASMYVPRNHAYSLPAETPPYYDEIVRQRQLQQIRQQNLQQLKLQQQIYQQQQQQQQQQYQPRYIMEPDFNNNIDYSMERPKSISRIILSPTFDDDSVIIMDGPESNRFSYPITNGQNGHAYSYIQNSYQAPPNSVVYRNSSYMEAGPWGTRYQIVNVTHPRSTNQNMRSLSRASRPYSTYDYEEPARIQRSASMVGQPPRVGSRLYVHQ